MQRWKPWFVCLATAIMLAGCGSGGSGTGPEESVKLSGMRGSSDMGPDGGVTLRLLSGSPKYVSGGDARIEVKAAQELQDKLTFLLNGEKITPPLVADGNRMEGVVSGLVTGDNLLEVQHVRRDSTGVSDAIRLTNYPLTGPMFTGPQQQPFICRTQESGLGQPLVDNQDGIGHPVFSDPGKTLIGYSSYCAVPPRILYVYYTGDSFRPFDPATGYDKPPPDLKTIRTASGASVPFVVRVEAGSINRFLYSIAMLAPAPVFDQSAWNRKLIYWLRGGVGIGHQQGTAMWFNDGLSGAERQLMPRLLEQGFAVVSSSGNETGVHYNMRLAEETAMMTKEHFIKAYGLPRFTIGIGGSGGAVQQYAFAQNRPGLLDGGIPIESFPDMVTQTIPISDCPLLGQYAADEVALDAVSRWATWSNLTLIEGMNASDTVINPLTGKPGSSECLTGWQTAMPTVLNPAYKDPRYDDAARAYGYPASVFANVKWTHWNDLANIYGTDALGYAPIPIDNVGVQYGLSALAKGRITAAEFLRLNACVGGWKSQVEFVAWEPNTDPYDARNMLRSADCREPGGTPAPRRAGDVSAMRSAYSSGHVFTGQRLDIPMIDLRPYLEPELNMHNSRQSFSVRARLREANEQAADNQVIWFAGSEASLPGLILDALAVVDRHLSTGSKPIAFIDKCVDAAGAAIAAGATVWDGVLDQKPPGACTQAYPTFASPRMVAGESIKGDTFKCALKPVSIALIDGTYPSAVRFTRQQEDWLRRIFPDGVCDFTQPDQGRPVHWRGSRHQR